MYQRGFIVLLVVVTLILYLSSRQLHKYDTSGSSSLNSKPIGKSKVQRRAEVKEVILQGSAGESSKAAKRLNNQLSAASHLKLLFEDNDVSGRRTEEGQKDPSGLGKLMSTKNDLVTRLIGKDPDKRSSPYIYSYNYSLYYETKRHRERGLPIKTILYWQEDYYVPFATENFASKCKRFLDRTCKVTVNISQHAKVDAIIFHASRISLMKPPFKKAPGQIWIARGLESPVHWRIGYRKPGWKGVFNWTMTYRPDSEVFAPVGSLFRRPEPPFLDHRKIALGKTRSVAWFVSDCSTDSKREDYVNEMKKYIDVDIYGACGDLVCKKGGPDCTWMLSEKYRFYLAFENSYCPYYVTEKFFTKFGGLESPIYVIPVVRGGSDYRKYFPDATYINADDFRSAKDLADYLNALSDDVDAYAALLERKAHFGYRSLTRGEEWCRLCDLLHDPDRPVNIYQDLGAWWDQVPCLPSPEIVT